MVLLGAGLGLTTAPGTEAIMGSLSADKAGVGSAVNDTTRELGGTLGVAIVGSVFASIYSSRLADAPAVQALPEETRAIMGESMAAAQQVIAQLPPAVAPAVRNAVEIRVSRRPVDRIAGRRGYRLDRCRRRRRVAARQGAPNSAHRNDESAELEQTWPVGDHPCPTDS